MSFPKENNHGIKREAYAKKANSLLLFAYCPLKPYSVVVVLLLLFALSLRPPAQHIRALCITLYF